MNKYITRSNPHYKMYDFEKWYKVLNSRMNSKKIIIQDCVNLVLECSNKSYPVIWFWLLVYEHLVSIQDSKKYSSLIKNAAINWLLHHIHDLKGYWWAFTLIGLGLV